MNKYFVGFLAGFIATTILSLLMILKEQMGLMPQLNVIRDFNQYLGAATPILGWIIHFILGTLVWGCLFVLLSPALNGPYWLKGIYFGIIAWLLMMVGYMPVMDHGFFAANLGVQITIATLVLHLVYGFVLGLIYGLIPKERH